jgi:hypothetical protein
MAAPPSMRLNLHPPGRIEPADRCFRAAAVHVLFDLKMGVGVGRICG